MRKTSVVKGSAEEMLDMNARGSVDAASDAKGAAAASGARVRSRKVSAARTGAVALITVGLSVSCIPGVLAIAQEGGVPVETYEKVLGGDDAASTASFEKNEIVYASFSAEGDMQGAYVVNRFEVSEPGLIVDYGDYDSVVSLTSQTALDQAAGRVSFDAEEGTFFYQGNDSDLVLPWNVSIAFTLDGKAVSAEDLAGATGELGIHVTTSRNEEANVDEAFFDSYMLQVTFTLPGEAVNDIVAEGATVASSGMDRTVAFTALPGQDGDFTLTAQVRDFTMDGAQIVALPYTSVIDMPDTDGMVDDMSQLTDAVSQLSEGTTALAQGSDELAEGTSQLASGISSFGDALDQLDAGSSSLTEASEQIGAALDAAAAGLNSADFSQLDQLVQLAGVLNQLADGLNELQAQVQTVSAGYAQAEGALGSAVAAIPDGTLTEDEIASLMGLAQSSANPQDAVTASELVQTYQAAQAVKATYAACAQAFSGAGTLLATLGADAQNGGALAQQSAALRACAAQIEGSGADAGSSEAASALAQILQLASGMEQLAQSYAQFHEGLVQYTGGTSALAQNFAQVESGAGELADGAHQAADGTWQLVEGAETLNEATIDLPDTMRAQIDELMADYDFPTFEPRSFISEKNENTTEVQFVLTTAAIEKQEAEEVEEAEPEQSMWDRFLNLFQGSDD